MTIFLILLALAAAFYGYAFIAYYYGFKNWYPLCGCRGGRCGLEKPGPSSRRP